MTKNLIPVVSDVASQSELSELQPEHLWFKL